LSVDFLPLVVGLGARVLVVSLSNQWGAVAQQVFILVNYPVEESTYGLASGMFNP